MTITPEEHSGLVGGSTAAQRLNCPRSYAIEQTIPKNDEGSIYAQEGTALHEIMAIALERDVEPTTLLPFTYTAPAAKGGWSFTVDADLWVEKGEPALAAFDAFVAEHETRIGADMRLIVETRVAFPGIPGAFGTSDVMAKCGDEIFIMDWKFGNGIVPAEENEQLMFYACGALNTSKEFFGDVSDNTPVTMAIVQPTRSKGIDVWSTTVARLRRFEADLQSAVAEVETLRMAARVKAGPWCKFKRCVAKCPLRTGAAQKLADRFDDLKRAVEGKSNSVGSTLSEMMDLVDLVEPMCKEVRKLAMVHIESGGELDGWTTRPGRQGTLKWAKDKDIVLSELLAAGADLEKIAPRTLITPTQATKITGGLPEGVAERGESSSPTLVRKASPA